MRVAQLGRGTRGPQRMTSSGTLSIKIDVCTHDGMRDGVPRLLEQLRRHAARATFFLAFGPDNSGKALRHAWRPSFVRKMLKSSAPSLYGWRTMLSGTLLSARPIATNHPDLVRRIEAEGHEVALHAWDHRRWQDHLFAMDDAEITAHFRQECEAYEAILGHAPRASGAAAWVVSERSLAVADSFGFLFASDLRGGPPCRLRHGAKLFATPQIPTVGRCIEELLTQGLRGDAALASALLADLRSAETAVFAVHAEVEGGPFATVLERLLPQLAEQFGAPRLLSDVARELSRAAWPVRRLDYTRLPGRSGQVATSSELEATP